MTVANTSMLAYEQHKRTGKIAPQQRKIVDALEFGFAFSRRELVKLTGMELSSVCGRVNELLQLGLIAETTPRACSETGRMVRPVVLAQQKDGAE